MQVGQMQQAQQVHAQQMAATAHAIAYPDASAPAYGTGGYAAPPGESSGSALYPSLDDYMGLSQDNMKHHMSQALVVQEQQVAVPSSGSMAVSAPVTGNSVGLRRAEIKQGVRPIQLCKDDKGKMGLRVRSVNKGLFVAFVHVGSPAALAGLRFGDQILQINDQTVAGWDTDKAMKVLQKSSPEAITMAVRDRPFERTLTLQKDSTGHIGFVFKDGRITSLVKDSSAARNGVLTEHQLVEVNGQNVVAMKNKEIGDIIASVGQSVTITIIPSFIYDHIVKSMGSSLMKKFMDHSIPDI